MGPRNATRRPGGGASAVISLDETIATKYSTRIAQVYDCDGHRLPARPRCRVYGAPRLARPSWVRWAADRWCEAQP